MAVVAHWERDQSPEEFRFRIAEFEGLTGDVLRAAGRRAGELLVNETVPGVPKRSGAAAGSIGLKESSGDRFVIEAGGSKAPYYPWLDFGGRVGRRGSVKRTVIKKGRYLYPTYDDLKGSGKFADIAAEEQRRAGPRAGLHIVAG